MSAFEGLNLKTAGYEPQGRVTQAIATASRRTGVDFNYLMSQAKIESAMNPTARAQTSSATGLYQFIDQSWLGIINDHGAKYGMDWAANAIKQTSNGHFYVSDPTLRKQILDLRNHPETASVMAAELASDNRDYLEQRIGRQAEPVDLYLAHFLGAGGAAKFLTSMQAAPGMAAASLFPAAARANSSIFYDKSGNARSLTDIRSMLERKFDGASTGFQVDSAGPAGGATYTLPDGTRMVQPADYMRIAQQHMAQGNDGTTANPLSLAMADPATDNNSGQDSDTTLLNDIQALTLNRAATTASLPRNETARLAYLMLATLGR